MHVWLMHGVARERGCAASREGRGRGEAKQGEGIEEGHEGRTEGKTEEGIEGGI